MKFVAPVLAGLAVLLLAGACGETGVGKEPSLTVGFPESTPPGPDVVYTFALAPTGRPSGRVAFRAVHAGETDTLLEVPFRSLEKPGSVTVHVTPRRIEVTCDLPGQTGGTPRAEVGLPRAWRVVSTASCGCTVGPADLEGERVVWVHTLRRRAAEGTPGGSDSLGPLAATVTASRGRPDLVVYCLTVAVDAP